MFLEEQSGSQQHDGSHTLKVWSQEHTIEQSRYLHELSIQVQPPDGANCDVEANEKFNDIT